MVQNADDAGATEVNFCLDRRQHGTEKLAYRKMEAFQGKKILNERKSNVKANGFFVCNRPFIISSQ